jgi:hypothetical protein
MSRQLPVRPAERPESFIRRHLLALSFVTFVGLAGLWLVVWLLRPPVWEPPSLRRATRALGYVALVALLIPYGHVARRLVLNRRAVLGFPLGRLTFWMGWHLGAAYAAFFLTLVHSRTYAKSPLTSAILVLIWAAMLSGVAGFFGTRFFYRILALTVEREVGMERLAGERKTLSARSAELARSEVMLRAEDVVDWRGFCSQILRKGSTLNEKLAKPLGKAAETVIDDALHAGTFTAQLQAEVMEKVNALLKKPGFSTAKDFQTLNAAPPPGDQPQPAPDPTRPAAEIERRRRLAGEVAHWAVHEPKSDWETERRNRVFLEALCPAEIVESAAPPEGVKRFFEQAAKYLQTADPSWTWLFSPQALEPLSGNHYLRARELASPGQRRAIDDLWKFVQRRRDLDVEYWFHRLTRAWLLVHGPAAWALLVLVVAHAVSSIYYGGFF